MATPINEVIYTTPDYTPTDFFDPANPVMDPTGLSDGEKAGINAVLNDKKKEGERANFEGENLKRLYKEIADLRKKLADCEDGKVGQTFKLYRFKVTYKDGTVRYFQIFTDGSADDAKKILDAQLDQNLIASEECVGAYNLRPGSPSNFYYGELGGTYPDNNPPKVPAVPDNGDDTLGGGDSTQGDRIVNTDTTSG